MLELTAEGQRVIDDLARRHGISPDATSTLLSAVVAGQGSMAQFNHSELGGSGQWMRGGMTMVGDMFNHGLKATVDAVCMELATLIDNQPAAFRGGSQMQSQGGLTEASRHGSGVSLFVPSGGGSGGNWWPDDLGAPGSTGQQNSVRYAYFPATRRLAIDLNGRVQIYDTDDHAITGFSQQQSGDASLTFTSQHGIVALSSLKRIEDAAALRRPEERAAAEGPVPPRPASQASPVETTSAPESRPATPAPSLPPQDSDVFTMIERLADLHAKGILSDEEFTQKKAELLKRV